MTKKTENPTAAIVNTTYYQLFAVCLILVGTPLLADDTAPLGSPDFYPSPEHPVGWRGDGSGRFPGATPPTVWSRRLADITSEIMVQAVKPKGNPEPTVTCWVISR